MLMEHCLFKFKPKQLSDSNRDASKSIQTVFFSPLRLYLCLVLHELDGYGSYRLSVSLMKGIGIAAPSWCSKLSLEYQLGAYAIVNSANDNCSDKERPVI